jgi:hypothetical protein
MQLPDVLFPSVLCRSILEVCLGADVRNCWQQVVSRRSGIRPTPTVAGRQKRAMPIPDSLPRSGRSRVTVNSGLPSWLGTCVVPHFPHSIELHDSRVSAIILERGIATVRLRPAYVHGDGKGWSQDADIIIQESTVEGIQMEFPATIADGTLRTDKERYYNILYLPLAERGPVSLELEFFSGKVSRIWGALAEVVLVSAPVFLEDVSGRI